MFIGANEIIQLSSLKECFFRYPLIIINKGEICGIRSTKRFDCKMLVQVSIAFSNLRLAISCLSRSHLRNYFLLCYFCSYVLNRSILGLLGLNNFILYFFDPCCVPLYFKFKKQPFHVFRSL